MTGDETGPADSIAYHQERGTSNAGYGTPLQTRYWQKQ
jgi:hypothetical protein